uniref:VM domain-containing protein n=1 Tax=Anopheles epiroticus TaxID=199890 RepID=A0A182PAD6_9DIPT
MKVLFVLPLALVYAGTEKDAGALGNTKQSANDQQFNQLGTKKEKRGIFGFGGYAPAAPVYGHAFAHPVHQHLLPAADPFAPVALAAPAAVPALAGPYLGSHAHTHTVVTKKCPLRNLTQCRSKFMFRFRSIVRTLWPFRDHMLCRLRNRIQCPSIVRTPWPSHTPFQCQ